MPSHQRMLAVGWLNHGEIAREVSVCRKTVDAVVMDRRVAVSTDRPIVLSDLGERFLPEPVRCGGCGGMIEIMPCRVCRARGDEAAGEARPVVRGACAVDRQAAVAAMIGITGQRYGWQSLLWAAMVHLPIVRLLVRPDTNDAANGSLPFCTQAVARACRVDPVPRLADRLEASRATGQVRP